MRFIFLLIDHNTQQILARQELATAQYNLALYKLSKINGTVNFFLDLLDKTRHVSVCGHIQFVIVD
jgi:hypothetical protein